MPKTKPPSSNARVCAATLEVATLSGWPKVTLEAVAKSAKIPASELKKRFASPADLAALIVEEIDLQTFSGLAKPSGSAHDILFDIFMARFDLLQKNRKAFLSMADSARKDRALSCALLKSAGPSLERLIKFSRLTFPPRPVLKAGLALVHTWTFFVWRRDESVDMSKTMAALDRALRLASKAAGFLAPKKTS